MDILAVKAGRCKAVWQYWNEQEAKLVFVFGEDHNIVRARGVEYFIEKGKYEVNQYGVLVAVEWWEWVIEPMEEEMKEENKSETLRAEEAKLVINFGEKKEDVMRLWVEHFIASGKYTRNDYGVLVQTEWETVEVEQIATETSQSDVLNDEKVEEITDLQPLDEMSLEDLQKLYVEKTGKNLSPAVKNNKEWIISKL